MVGREMSDGVFVDEPLTAQPLDGSALGSNITQVVPGRDQFGVVLVELVLESSERSSSPQCVAQALADFAVADALGEVAIAIGAGASIAEVVASLFMSEATVKAHVSRIFTKLDVTSRVQIAIVVHDAGQS